MSIGARDQGYFKGLLNLRNGLILKFKGLRNKRKSSDVHGFMCSIFVLYIYVQGSVKYQYSIIIII